MIKTRVACISQLVDQRLVSEKGTIFMSDVPWECAFAEAQPLDSVDAEPRVSKRSGIHISSDLERNIQVAFVFAVSTS